MVRRRSRAVGESAFPHDVELELATLSARAPGGPGVLHEIKLDGYRMVARVDGAAAQLLSRKGKDASSDAPSVIAELRSHAWADTVLDGELVALRSDGRSDFGLLQRSLGSRSLVYVVFDVLVLQGRDVRGEPLRERKRLLAELFAGVTLAHVRVIDFFEGQGPAVYEQACKLKLEGIVSKRADAPYRGGRSNRWIKTKCSVRSEFAIVGFRTAEGLRSQLSSLLLAASEGDALRYIGKVGTGFSDKMVRDFYVMLSRDRVERALVVNPPRGAEARGVNWVQPRYLAHVSYTELTRGGTLRHPVFRGLRLASEAEREPAGR